MRPFLASIVGESAGPTYCRRRPLPYLCRPAVLKPVRKRQRSIATGSWESAGLRWNARLQISGNEDSRHRPGPPGWCSQCRAGKTSTPLRTQGQANRQRTPYPAGTGASCIQICPRGGFHIFSVGLDHFHPGRIYLMPRVDDFHPVDFTTPCWSNTVAGSILISARFVVRFHLPPRHRAQEFQHTRIGHEGQGPLIPTSIGLTIHINMLWARCRAGHQSGVETHHPLHVPFRGG